MIDPIPEIEKCIAPDERHLPVTTNGRDLLILLHAARIAERERRNRSEARWWFWVAVAFLAFNALLLVADPGWWRAAIAAVWVGLALFWAWMADWKVGRQA